MNGGLREAAVRATPGGGSRYRNKGGNRNLATRSNCITGAAPGPKRGRSRCAGTIGQLDCSSERASGDAQRPFGLVDGRDEILTVVVGVGGDERSDALLIRADRIRRRTQLRHRRTTHGDNHSTPPLTSPTVERHRSTTEPAELVPVRGDLATMVGYHSAQVDVDVRLNTNESPFPPPPDWLDEFVRELADISWNRYPDRSVAGLRSDIAAFHGVAPSQVFAGNGSNEVLQTLLLAYAGPGRSVVVFEPTYQLHGHIARITGADVVAGVRGDDFTIDPGYAAAFVAARDPAVTFLCSPNNPTGLIESPAVLDAVLGASTGLVVVDEAYCEFSSWSALDRVADAERLVVVRTFSKTWSMAATRLGYLVAPSWVVAQLEKVVLPYHLDAAKQLAGRLALRHVDEMGRRVRALVEERGRVSAALAELGVEVFPSGANFVLFRTTGHDAGRVWQRLVDDGVLIRDCSGWSYLDGCLRVTIGLPEENDRFLAAMAHALDRVNVAGESK